MRAFGFVAFVALVACAAALAKLSISIAASDTTPAVGQGVAVVVRSGRALDYDLRLIAVAPGQPVFRVVATITGDTRYPDPNVARHASRSTSPGSRAAASEKRG